MDVITVKIKITNGNLLPKEKTEVIKNCLSSVIYQLEETQGNLQQAKAKDEDLIIEYVHLKNN